MHAAVVAVWGGARRPAALCRCCHSGHSRERLTVDGALPEEHLPRLLRRHLCAGGVQQPNALLGALQAAALGQPRGQACSRPSLRRRAACRPTKSHTGPHGGRSVGGAGDRGGGSSRASSMCAIRVGLTCGALCSDCVVWRRGGVTARPTSLCKARLLHQPLGQDAAVLQAQVPRHAPLRPHSPAPLLS